MRKELLAEGLGALLLATAVIGSGIMAERLAGGNQAIALLANTGATVAALATLIAMLGPVSGAHFNPVVTDRRSRPRRSDANAQRSATWRSRSRVAAPARCLQMPCLSFPS